MRRTSCLLLTAILMLMSPALFASQDCVILLHGLGRTANSMSSVATALRDRGYAIRNQSYPSTEGDVATLARQAIEPAVQYCAPYPVTHFVTHSLGGILVRQHLQNNPLTGRVIMLSPPNAGSHIPDLLNRLPAAGSLLGPAALELGTDPASVPNALPPLSAETLARIGVITGTRSSDPWFSWLIPGTDDGKVAVTSASLSSHSPLLQVPYGHSFIMKYRPVIDQVIAFLATGRFQRGGGAMGQ